MGGMFMPSRWSPDGLELRQIEGDIEKFRPAFVSILP
jgi:hypothetical protein